MKGILVLLTGMLLLGMSITATIPGLTGNNPGNSTTVMTPGSFEGTLGPRLHGNATVGTFSGSYMLRHNGGRFTGDWNFSFQNKSASGTMNGVFARRFMIGRLTIAETNRKAPIVGFLRVTNDTFVGRVMAPVGPALYFWGTYT